MSKDQTDPPPKPMRWSDELELLALSGGEQPPGDARPQAEDISVSSVWQMESPESADQALGEATASEAAYVYRRDGHPNERNLSRKLAALHSAASAALCAQGMSALASVAWTVLRPGARVWIGNELYGKSSKLFGTELPRWGVEVMYFDPCSEEDITGLRESQTDLVLVETMTNPRLRVPDLGKLAEATHAAGGRLLVDNTFATHLLARPLTLGADLVVESLSKQVNGHSDSMLGLVCAAERDLMRRISDTISTFGMASSPLDCFLTHRGLISLGLRVERACRNALSLAKALDQLPDVRVDYPGLSHHPHHYLAARQLRGGFGWMLTITLDVDRRQVTRLLERLKPEIQFVPSLGDACTTISHPATTSQRGMTPEQRAALGIHEGTLRISCGIEPTEALVARFLGVLK
jgi:cystathionine beta-lyase/cystathionine gamma-synthase